MTLRKKIAYSFLVVLLIIAVGIAYIWYEFGRPAREIAKNPFMHSISKQTRQWDTRVDLIPEPLTLAMNYEDVESRLLAADFVLRTKRQYPRRQRYGEEALSPAEASLKKPDEIVFSIYHSNYVCRIEYVVFLQFNELNQLTSAQGMQGERGCL